MNDNRDQFSRAVDAKARRKLRAHTNPQRELWFGMGMIGLVGWSVVVPTLLGAALGQWLDRFHPGGRDWTLALLVAGLLIGCINAWRWVVKEDMAIHEAEAGDEGADG
jgi:ATP synthase protein I